MKLRYWRVNLKVEFVVYAFQVCLDQIQTEMEICLGRASRIQLSK